MPAGGDGPKGTIPYQRRRDGWGEGGGGRKGVGEERGGGYQLSHMPVHVLLPRIGYFRCQLLMF